MDSASFLIVNARCVSHGNRLEAVEIMVHGTKIAAVSPPGTLSIPSSLPIVDAQDALVLPGLIDPHVHLRDSGVPNADQRLKEDFGSGTKAAVAGGVTTVFDMPNTVPPTTTVEALQAKAAHAAKTAYCDFGFFAGAATDNVGKIPAMLEAGAVGVKMYVGSSTGNLLVSEARDEESFFKASAKLGFVLAIHAEDQGCLETNAAFHESQGSPRHNEVRPSECAGLAVQRAVDFTRTHRNRTYVCHASTAAEAELVRSAKKEGLSIFMEIAPHHLFLDETEQDVLGNNAKVNPPLRPKSDVKALWTALNDGTADTIGTDHAPHTLQQKRQPYWDAPSGMPGLETMLPLMVTAAMDDKTTLETVQRLCCHNPARIFGLHGKGRLEPGFDADLVFVDLKTERAVDESKLFTRCGWSPYAGMRLRGWPVKTYLRGRLVFDQGKLAGPFGKSVPIEGKTDG